MTRINPLPSLIRASAHDAAAASARAAGRSKWSRGDYNKACATQERLVRACYAKPGEAADSPWCYIRFGIAEKAERDGVFTLDSDFGAVFDAINDAIEQAP